MGKYIQYARIFAFVAFASFLAPLAFAQQPPTAPPLSYYPSTVSPVSLAVTSTTGRVALPAAPSTYPGVAIVNNGPSEIFCKAGGSGVTVSTSVYTFAIPPSAYRAFWDATDTYLACITASSTAEARITQSNGAPTLGFLSGGASGDPTGPAGGDLTGEYPDPSVSTYNGGTTIGTAAHANTGTSGATVPLLNGANSWSAAQTFAAVVLPASTTGVGAQTLTNSPCTGLTTAKWVPVTITGLSGTYYIPACQ